MNLGEYIKNKQIDAENRKQQPQNTLNPQEAFNKYSNYNEQELMQELFRNAEESRNNGQLDNNMLDDFYNQAKSMLTKEQSERMQELILQLKK